MKITSIKNITFLLAFTACFSQASESLNQKTWFSQAIDSIGQSSFMHSCSKCVQGDPERTFPNMPLITAGPASEQYQTLGKEAQQALQQHVPIIKMSKNYPLFEYRLATANSDAIYVNEEKLAKISYGAQRSIFMHEATHLKYHDMLTNTMFSLASLIGGTFGTSKILKSLNMRAGRKTASFVVGMIAACQCFQKYASFYERRADIQGHYATQCSRCVQDAMQFNKNNCIDFVKTTQSKELSETEMLALLPDVDQQRASSGGYLTQAELAKIAQDLGDKKCTYHSEQK